VPRKVSERRTSCDQDEAPAPARLKVGPVDEFRAPDGRILDQDPVVSHPAEHYKPPVVALGKSRQRQLRKAPVIRRDGSRLEPQVLGAAQNLGGAKRPAPELVPNLAWIGSNLMKPKEQNQRFYTGFPRLNPGRTPH
jgi:hypothetical protein